jgi:hypothetical protein
MIILQDMSHELKENPQIYYYGCKRLIHHSLGSSLAANSCNQPKNDGLCSSPVAFKR